MLRLQHISYICSRSTELRTGVELAKNLSSYVAAPKLVSLCLAIEKPLSYTRLLGIGGAAAAVFALYRLYSKKKHRDTIKKRIVNIASQIRFFASNSANFIKGLEVIRLSAYLMDHQYTRSLAVYKVVQAAAIPLWMVGSALSVVYFARHILEYGETVKVLEKLEKDPPGFIDTMDLQSDVELPAHFLSPVDSVRHAVDRRNYLELNRSIRASLDNKRIMLLTDTLFAVGSWCQIFKIYPKFSTVCKGISFCLLHSNNAYYLYSTGQYKN